MRLWNLLLYKHSVLRAPLVECQVKASYLKFEIYGLVSHWLNWNKISSFASFGRCLYIRSNTVTFRVQITCTCMHIIRWANTPTTVHISLVRYCLSACRVTNLLGVMDSDETKAISLLTLTWLCLTDCRTRRRVRKEVRKKGLVDDIRVRTSSAAVRYTEHQIRNTEYE